MTTKEAGADTEGVEATTSPAEAPPSRGPVREFLARILAALPDPLQRACRGCLALLRTRRADDSRLPDDAPCDAEALPESDRAPAAEHAEASDSASAPDSYADKIRQETEIFEDQVEVHDLPAIFHYWSNRYLLPMEQEFGFSNPDEFFVKFLADSGYRDGSRKRRFASLGSGNCDTELRVCKGLLDIGIDDFVLECIDINRAMLDRGEHEARRLGLEHVVRMTQADFNSWTPEAEYDAIMANQSLHHVLELEALFASVKRSLREDGRFVVSDIIGRNGHMRWPEAREILDEYWERLPASARFNLQLRRQEDRFQDWDCSVEGFEGIRAQDILPLLVGEFGFEVFLPFSNVIDPFIDRSFGPHLDPENERHRQLVDEIHARDEAELAAGTITPTHMMAVMVLDRSRTPQTRQGLTPERCIRHPGG